jgi:superfamily II DNA helicase RecQ
MQLKIFYISVHDTGAMQEDMNLFLRTHKVIRIIDKEHIDNEGFMFWSFRVWYIEGEVTKSVEEARQVMRGKYKETVEQMKNNLNEEQKAIFERLRKCRQTIADEDAIRQNYDVFSDKELLLITNLSEITEKNILEHDEIKKERKEKYAKRLIEKFEGIQVWL